MDVVIDGRKYDLDILKVENCIYSVILNGKSHELQVSSGKSHRNFSVACENMTYDIEIIDPFSKYIQNRSKGGLSDGKNVISSPMPGKVVRIPVSEGEQVEVGTTVIVISAMKMESEYKVTIAGIVKKINVVEGDVIEGNKPLIIIE